MAAFTGGVVFLSLATLVCSHVHVHRSSVNEYLNTCLDGQNQKSKPGPEDSLFQHCAPWSNRSCCTSEVAQSIHVSKKWLNFDMNHCQELSANCRKRFLTETCFYECSPNVGPWLVEDKRKIRNDRFIDVPLCRDDCDDWWADCQNEFTCLENWEKGFNWSTGTNTCPSNKPCRPFKDIYSNSTHFCEAIWGQSWKVVNQAEPCMTFSFDAVSGNPNDAVARQYAEALVNKSSSFKQASFAFCFMLSITIIFTM